MTNNEKAEAHVREIKEYLKILDLIIPTPVDTIASGSLVEGYDAD